MTADLFLTCFLACTFSFVAFGVLGWQVTSFLFKRWFRKNGPALVASVMGNLNAGMTTFDAGMAAGINVGDPDGKLRESFKAHQDEHAISGADIRCPCGFSQTVPVEVLSPDVLFDFLKHLGWRYVGQPTELVCPTCSKRAAA